MRISQTRQSGMTLIEMMIAMVVSLVLIAGVGTIYMSSKRNYQTRDQLSLMNETGRVALESLRQHLEHAGYATPAKLPLGAYFYVNGDADPKAGNCGTMGSNSLTALKQMATRDIDTNSATAYGDTISVRFVGDATLSIDALGSLLDAPCHAGASGLESALVYNGFHVDTSASVKDSTGMRIPILYGAGSNGNSHKQPLVNGVENLQFEYGVDSDNDGNTNYFANATTVTANAAWERVVSIKVALLVRSQEPVLTTNTAQSYNLLGVVLTRNDRYQRAVYTTTIQLRNVREY